MRNVAQAVFFLSLLQLGPCYLRAANDEDSDEAAKVEFFERQVRPLLDQHCFECHSGDEHDGGLRLDSKPAWERGGDSGIVIRPGDPEKSRLMEAIRYSNLDLQMPPSGKLAASEIATLEEWIAGGAVDPRATESEPTSVLKGMSIEEGRTFWSMLPLNDPAVPDVKNLDWVSSPIDAFVLAELEAAGLSPAPPADRRTLLRRVTFDLTGLPPSLEEIEAFLADESPDAFRRVVDRLLQSPHYGERWGRHWLDVVRYADSNGLDENLAYGNAWRYRDYVISSFNSDKPFDQFVMEQIAGDLLPYATEETKTATGYLSLGAKVLAEPDREKLTMDTIDEQIDTMGKTFLGLTLGCARCHDHKFDPIKQQDYYALAAIFKSTRTFGATNTGAIKHWYEHSFASEAERQQLEPIEAEIKAKNSAAASFKNNAMAKIRADAIAKAAAYLSAASRFSPSDPHDKIHALASEYGLHERMLHHCRLHLEYNSDDPFVTKWLELIAANASPASIESFFGQLFQAADTQKNPTEETPATAVGGDKTEAQVFDAELVELAKKALADPAGFLAVPPQPEHAFDEETLQQYYQLMEEARLVESAAPDEASAMGVCDGTILSSVPIAIRGSHLNLGQPVEREFPQVLRLSEVRPIFPRGQSGRLELANWITSSRNPLTARVFVNRVWRWHFGTGLVASTDNFGVLGDKPTHPDLLDWLARGFIESGWTTKDLHRQLLLSSTYQMSSVHPQEEFEAAIDSENRLLWKTRIQRLEAEEIRDAILSVAGRLDKSMHGKTVPLRNRQFVFNHTSVDHTKYDSLRRAVYLPVIRNNLYTFFEQFDFPDPTMPTGSRNATVVAPQALLMMNDDLVLDSAESLARLTSVRSPHLSECIEYAYQSTLGRLPTNQEFERARAFVSGGESEHERWTMFCHSLIACNEFIYLR
jgi:hypothetical protein